MTTLTTVIPVFNGERHIAATLASVADQTRRPDHLIVLDNCSSDATQSIVNNFAPIPCEWRQNETNLGLFGNLNRALSFAEQTEFLHLLHADDLIRPEFYERALAVLKPVAGRAMAFCSPDFIDDKGDIISKRKSPLVTTSRIVDKTTFIRHRAELRPIYFPGVLLKSSAQPSPCQYRSDFPQLADHIFWAEWARECTQVVELPTGLAAYRIHAASETKRNAAQLQSWVLDEWRVMETIRGLLAGRGISLWRLRQKQKLIFAARCEVKARQVQTTAPELARQIRKEAKRIGGRIGSSLARGVVSARNLVAFGKD